MKKLSFELREFDLLKHKADKMQNEFCELVSTELQKIGSFKGVYTNIPTGAACGKVKQSVFIVDSMPFNGIYVTVKFYLNFGENESFSLERVFIDCTMLCIFDREIPADGLKNFQIYYHNELGDICKKRVSVENK